MAPVGDSSQERSSPPHNATSLTSLLYDAYPAQWGAASIGADKTPVTIDVWLTVKLNQAFAPHLAGAALVDVLSNNNLFRGAPIVMVLALAWFRGDVHTNLRLILGLLGACFATLLSVGLQHAELFHIRPMLDPSLALRLPESLARENWTDTPGAWPSDTATLYVALTLLAALEMPAFGGPLALWTTVVILLPRIIFGYHYPSDVVSGAALGASAIALSRAAHRHLSPWLGPQAARVLTEKPAISNMCFTLCVWQLGDLMLDARAILHSVTTFLRS